MLGWIIIAILSMIAIFYVTRYSPILFGILIAIPTIYLGAYYVFIVFTFMLGMLIWWALNMMFGMEKSMNSKFNIIDSVHCKIVSFIGTVSVFVNYIAWPFGLGYVATVIMMEQMLPHCLDFMEWYYAEIIAGYILLFLSANTIFMYITVGLCMLKNHRST